MVTKRDQFIFFIIIFQPVIDIITSLSTRYLNHSITLGMIFRSLLLLFLMIYIFQYLFHHKKPLLFLYSISLLTVLLSLLVNYFLKNNFLIFEEINFAFKTIYFLMIVFISIILIDSKLINKKLIYKASNIICLVIGLSYWVSIITNTGINSYSYEGVGYSGWFYSANELSVIVIILLGLTLINLYKNKKDILSWTAFVLMLSMVSMIGTKTSFLGGNILVFTFLAYILYCIRLRIWKDKGVMAYCLILIIFLFTLPVSPFSFNTQERGYFSSEEQNIQKTNTENASSQLGFIQKLLSSRDIYFQKIKSDYKESIFIRKMVGLGYSGDYKLHPKLIEMDFFDLFFSYGVIGTFILLIPLMILIIRVFIFTHAIEIMILMLTLILCFGISFLAGHVLFAPSLMTYFGILFVILGLEKYDYYRQ